MLEQYLVTATVLRPGGRDNFGDELPAVEHHIPGCLIAPSAGANADVEPGDFTNVVISGAMLYRPGGGLDVRPSDRVRVRGVTYDVQGDVGDWGPAGAQVALRRSSG